MNGKTIRIYLADGTPTGILTAEIINWTGKVIVAPRAQLAQLAKREESKRTGIYCLVGPDPDSPGKDRVYVGEGDSVLARLTSHDTDEAKDFWNRVVMVISKDQNLTKAHVRYIESRLIKAAHEAGRASVANGTSPDAIQLPEPDVADMEYFIAQITMIFPVLGFGFLQPKAVASGEDLGGDSPVFVLNLVGTSAKARETDGEFVVMKGSTARKEGVDSWTSYKSLRDQLVEEDKLIPADDPKYFVFAEDIAFGSPSAGASVVAARNCNGRQQWKVCDTGQSYQEWYDQKLKAAGVKAENG